MNKPKRTLEERARDRKSITTDAALRMYRDGRRQELRAKRERKRRLQRTGHG